MTKKRKIIITSIIITIALAIIVILIFWNFFPKDQRKSRKLRGAKIIQKIFDSATSIAKKSKFTISGVIVDDAGNPVDKVKVSISQSYPKIFGTKSEDVDSKKVVNRNFNIELFGGAEITLDFYKDGYYSVTNKKISLPISKNSFVAFSSNTVKVDNLKIVLERHGKLARCKRKRFSFFIRKEKFFTSFSIPQLKQDSKDIPFDIVKNLLSGTIYPDVERDENGNIMKVPNNLGRMGPRTIYLNMVGREGDGFKLFNGIPHRGFIGIKDAPESGYVKQMVFHWPADMNKNNFFYYKFGDIYGKGVVRGFSCTSTGRIRIGIQVYQNIETDTDSKVRRNLRTR
jgi:hypothetical protein